MGDASEKNLSGPMDALLGYQIRRVSAAAMTRLAGDLSRLNLSPISATVLLIIAANPGETQAEIGRMLEIKRANMAPIIAKLDSEGLLTRTTNDGRSHSLVCTTEGKLRAKSAEQIMVNHDTRIFGKRDDADRKALLELLAASRRRLAELDDD